MSNVCESFNRMNIIYFQLVIFKRIQKEEASKIDLNQLRDFYSTDSSFKSVNVARRIMIMEELNGFQVTLSKDSPPERYNGIINLIYIFYNPKATSEEIESALVMKRRLEIN